MADKDFQIGIKTSGDASGAEQVTAALQQTRVAAEALAQTTAQTTDAASAAADAVKATGEATSDISEQAKAAAEALAKVDTAADELGESKATKQFADALGSVAAQAKAATEELQRTVRIVDNSVPPPRIGPRMEDGRFSPLRESDLAAETERAARQAEAISDYFRESAESMERVRAELAGVVEAEEEVMDLEQQRGVLAAQMLELSEALAAGDKEGALWLTREMEIRRQAIALQRQLKLSEEEALKVARLRVEAAARETEEKKKAGPHWDRVANNSRVIASNLINGSTSLSSWTGMLANIGPQFAGIGLAAAGAAKIFHSLEAAATEAEKNALAAARRAEDLEKFRVALEKLDEAGLKGQAGTLKEAGERLRRQREDLEAEKGFLIRLTEWLSDSDHAFDFLTGSWAGLSGGYEGYLKKLVALDDEVVDNTNRLAATEKQRAKVAKEVAIGSDVATKRIDDATKSLAQLREEAAKENFATWSDSDKIVEYSRQINVARRALGEFGVTAATPEAAMESLSTLSDVQKVKVAELAVEWAKLENSIAKATQSMDTDIAERTKQLKELERTIKELRGAAEEMREAGKSYVEVDVLDEQRQLTKRWFREEDTEYLGLTGKRGARTGAQAVDDTDPDLKAWQETSGALGKAETTASEHRAAVKAAADAAKAAADAQAAGAAETKSAMDAVASSARTSAEQQTAGAAEIRGAIESGSSAVTASIAPISAAVASGTQEQIAAFGALSTALGTSHAAVISALTALANNQRVFQQQLAGIARSINAR